MDGGQLCAELRADWGSGVNLIRADRSINEIQRTIASWITFGYSFEQNSEDRLPEPNPPSRV